MANKEATVAELTEHFRTSSTIVLTEYRGLSVAQLKELRRGIQADATYAVVKNTLTKIAAKEAGIDAFDGMLIGPSALAFVHGDAVTVAKSLRDFAKDNPALVIKGGYFDGAPISPAEVMQLATSKPERSCSQSSQAPSRLRCLALHTCSTPPWRRPFAPSTPSARSKSPLVSPSGDHSTKKN